MQRGVIETWDERRGKGWVICGEETIFFPRIALCNNAVIPRAGQHCFFRVAANERGTYCNHVFVISDKEESV
jgi:hypothetical protein